MITEVDSSTVVNCPQLVSKYRTPKILWHQTDNAIFMRIPLVDVQKYKIKVDCESFRFSTKLLDHNYFFGIQLFGTVIAEKTSHVNVGREIKVCLIKALKWTDWPRLSRRKEKNLLIIVDPDYIVKKSWDDPCAKAEERESFSDYKKRHNITNIPPPPSSESDCSDSDDENLICYD